MRLSLRLRYISEGDFRYGARRMIDQFREDQPLLSRALRSEDVVAFVSKTGRHIRFCYRINGVEDDRETCRQVYTTVVAETGSGKWSPLLLSHYAETVGITLIGFSSFREYFERQQRSRRRSNRRAA